MLNEEDIDIEKEYVHVSKIASSEIKNEKTEDKKIEVILENTLADISQEDVELCDLLFESD